MTVRSPSDLPITGVPRDLAGAETLEIMRAAPRYNRWQFDRIAPYLGRRICEIGAGIGNMSALIRSHAPELLLLTDTDPFYRDVLTRTFADDPTVQVEELTLPDGSVTERLSHHRLDTVVALNVIEHIQDDVGALRSIADFLLPRGRLIILVPALRVLYGSLDRELGHARRYSREDVRRLLRNSGFELEHLFYFNLIGCLGWWYRARVRKSSRIPMVDLRLFDRLVPLLRAEDLVSLPLGQSLVAVGRRYA